MFIRYYLELPKSFAEVERALLTDPGSWLPGLATEAEDRGEILFIEVGFETTGDCRIGRKVQIEVGDPVSVASRSTMLPITWKPEDGSRALPQLDADIEISALGDERTHLAMSARYRPPFGMIGRAVDRAMMHRVAEATVKDFLDRVGDRLALRAVAPARLH